MAVDYESELQWASWLLDRGVLLLCGIDPATYRKAESAIHASVLPCEDNKLRPLEFLRWARRNRFPLPEELAAFLISRDKPPRTVRGEKSEGPLTESERNSLLKMILGMARAKYGYDSKNPRNPARVSTSMIQSMLTWKSRD